MIELLKSHWHGLKCEPPDFYGTDTRELFEHNLKRKPADWPWRTKKVYYTINSQGYRCPEFDQIDWANSVLLFGCSYVFAPGVDDSETMSAILTKELGRPVINLGQGATDDLFQFINSNILYKAGVRPYAVVYLWPGVHRLSELVGNKTVANWGSWNAEESEMAKHWVTNDVHTINFLHYLSQSVRNLWDCPVLEYYPYIHKEHDNTRETTLSKYYGGRLPINDTGIELWPTIKPWGHVMDEARDYGRTGAYHPGPQTLLNYSNIVKQDYVKIVK